MKNRMEESVKSNGERKKDDFLFFIFYFKCCLGGEGGKRKENMKPKLFYNYTFI